MIYKKNPVAKNAISTPNGLSIYLFFLLIVKLNIIFPKINVITPIIKASIKMK